MIGQVRGLRGAVAGHTRAVRWLDLETDIGRELGRWRFAILDEAGEVVLVAEDVEPGTWGERLELLTLVRALESLGEPTLVVLLRASPYLEEGLRFGLPQWRANQWQWEHFEDMVPIRNLELWQRLDWALRFHRIVIARSHLLVTCWAALPGEKNSGCHRLAEPAATFEKSQKM